MINFLKKRFYLFFFLLFLLSFFLIEGEFRYYLFFIWSIFLLAYSPFIRGSKNLIIFISFFFLFITFITVLFSHNLAVSLDKYLFYLFSISIFLFFLQIKKQLINIKLLMEYLLLLTLALNILVIFLNLFSDYNFLFQNMNLLVRSYGHNHYAVFLLLIIPIIWWTILKKIPSYFLHTKTSLLIKIVLLISSYFILLISLSRLALLIAISQFFAIFLLVNKNFYNFRKNKIFNIFLKITILLFLFVAGASIILSLPLFDGLQNCPMSVYEKNFCLSFSKNSRIFYWRQSWLTFKNYPIFGYGLGTFKDAARLFPIANERHSSYAHNIFLHNLAETGFFAGATFIVLIAIIFYQSFKKLNTTKVNQNLNIFLFIAALSSLLNAMFDFDWHFFVIFVLSLIFLAIILNSSNYQKHYTQKNNKKFKQFYLFLFIFSVLLIFMDLLIVRNIMNGRKHLEKIFPFFNIAVKSSLDEPSTTINDYENLYKWYRYDIVFISNFFRWDDLSRSRKHELYLDLASINPAGFINAVNFEEFSDCCLDEAEILAREWIQIVDKHKMLEDDFFFVSYAKKLKLANQFIDFAQRSYQEEKWSRASYFYQISHHLHPYVFAEFTPFFLDENEPSNLILFFTEFKDFPAREITDFYAYLRQYKQATDKLFQEDRLVEFEAMIVSILEQEPEFAGYFIGPLYEVTNDPERIEFLSKIEHRYII